MSKVFNAEKKAKLWADQLGTKIVKNLGNGNFGTAYLTSDDTVIKITSDKYEFLCASEMKGKDLKCFANIHDLEVFDDDSLGIHQEHLSKKIGLKRDFHKLFMVAWQDKYDQKATFNPNKDMAKIERDEASEGFISKFISKGMWKVRDGIKLLLAEAKINEIPITDMHCNNIGVKANGSFAVFDQRYDSNLVSEYECDAAISKVLKENQAERCVANLPERQRSVANDTSMEIAM